MPTSGVNFGEGVALPKILLQAVLCGYTIFVLLKHECSSLVKLQPEQYLQVEAKCSLFTVIITTSNINVHVL